MKSHALHKIQEYFFQTLPNSQWRIFTHHRRIGNNKKYICLTIKTRKKLLQNRGLMQKYDSILDSPDETHPQRGKRKKYVDPVGLTTCTVVLLNVDGPEDVQRLVNRGTFQFPTRLGHHVTQVGNYASGMGTEGIQKRRGWGASSPVAPEQAAIFSRNIFFSFFFSSSWKNIFSSEILSKVKFDEIRKKAIF